MGTGSSRLPFGHGTDIPRPGELPHEMPMADRHGIATKRIPDRLMLDGPGVTTGG
jgi:hypothetical protein